MIIMLKQNFYKQWRTIVLQKKLKLINQVMLHFRLLAMGILKCGAGHKITGKEDSLIQAWYSNHHLSLFSDLSITSHWAAEKHLIYIILRSYISILQCSENSVSFQGIKLVLIQRPEWLRKSETFSVYTKCIIPVTTKIIKNKNLVLNNINIYYDIKMRTFLKVLLFISLPLQYDEEMHKKPCQALFVPFSVSSHVKFWYDHFISNYFSLSLLWSARDKAS